MKPSTNLLLAALFRTVWTVPLSGNATALSIDASQGTSQVESRNLLPRLGQNDGSSYENAQDVSLDASGWLDAAEVDAWAMLCGTPPAPRILQRFTEETSAAREAARKRHYYASGAGRHPFQNPGEFGLSRPPTDSQGNVYDSAEEFPFEGANVLNENGRRVYLAPATQEQQSGEPRPIDPTSQARV